MFTLVFLPCKQLHAVTVSVPEIKHSDDGYKKDGQINFLSNWVDSA